MSAGHYRLGNLTAIVDRNRYSLDGPTEEIMALEPLADKWRAFGWDVREVDGHDIQQVVDALDSLPGAGSQGPGPIEAFWADGQYKYDFAYSNKAASEAQVQALAASVYQVGGRPRRKTDTRL